MITKIITEDHIQKAKKLIHHADKIVIVTHISPDGDAVGSSLALYHFLLEMDKQANVIVPNDFPDFLRWMHGANDIINYERNTAIAEETIAAAELIFCLDFNVLKRIGKLADPVGKSEAKKVMLDHHLSPGDFCDVTMSYPKITSTSEMVFRFICRMGYFDYITHSCAECIYTGMMTDTGAFTYSSNSEEIYYIIGELLRKGIDKDDIYSRVYNTYTESRIRMMGYALYEKMKVFGEYKAAIISLTKEEQRRFSLKKGDTEGIVNIPLSMKNVIFSVFMREDEDMIKISFRSKGQFPCNRFASENYGGGGHLNAAGGEYYGKLEDALKVFEQVLPGYKELLLKI